MIKCFGLIVFVLCPLWAQEGPFGSGLYQVMEKAACRSCHNPDGVASATRLQFPDPGSAPERIEAFGKSLVILVDREQPANSILLKKPTNRIPHGGGERIKPGSPDEAPLTDWIAKLARLSAADLAQAQRERHQRLNRIGPRGQSGLSDAHQEEINQAQVDFERGQEQMREYERELDHLGIWFADPADAVKAGCPGTVTPFDGDHNAGIQVLNTSNFPDAKGPLQRIK